MRARYLKTLQSPSYPEGETDNAQSNSPSSSNDGIPAVPKTPLDEARQEAEIMRIQEEIKVAKVQADIDRSRLEATAAKEREKAEAAIEAAEKARQQTQDVVVKTTAQASDAEHEVQLKRMKIANAEAELKERDLERQRAERNERYRAQRERIKNIFLCLFGLALLILIAIGLFRLYRWAVEEPLIKEVEKRVEVETIVETEKIVEKEVEIEVVPEECTQIRRNGKIYMSCDGVTIDGASTIGESGISKIPELID